MFRRATTVAITTNMVILAATPAFAATGPWSDHHGDGGRVTVAADRRSVTVCDRDGRDSLRFKVDYATDNPVGSGFYTVQAPQGGCQSDRTYVSRIKVFKLCIGHQGIGSVVWDYCNPSIQTN